LIEIRIHGRGGQGAVVASRLLAIAFFKEGKWVQSFPTFGAERRGAPVAAFVRADSEPITLRCSIKNPDFLMVLDSTLLRDIDVTAGLKRDGIAVINSDKPVELEGARVAVVDASRIAVELGLGTPAYPLVNTAMVGAFAGATGLVSLSSVEEAIREHVTVKVYENVEAAQRAFEEVVKLWT